jgi:hypothetical protein
MAKVQSALRAMPFATAAPILALLQGRVAFMHLCVYEGGLFFATSLRFVPPPVV